MAFSRPAGHKIKSRKKVLFEIGLDATQGLWRIGNIYQPDTTKIRQVVPPRWLKDNLTVDERRLLKDIKKDKETMYMWEDKGPSFTN